jgi:cytoskeleton protein RodZ
VPIDLCAIGQFLKKKREEKGLTIEHMSKALCLRTTLVRAVEAGDWTALPHQVYVRGYLKEYATYLKVYDQISATLAQTIEEPVVAAPDMSKTRRLEPKEGRGLPRRVFILAGVAILIATFFIFERTQRSGPEPPNPQKADAIAANPVANKVEPKPLPEIQEAKKLMVTCLERSWISIVIDGTEKKEFMLSPHEIVMLSAKEGFDILIGNAGGVNIFLNGKQIEFTGKSGEVKRIKLS